MQRSVTVLFLLCTVTFFGCGPKQYPELYIYCNETFWYAMQEEALFFNKIYGFHIILIPIRSPKTSASDSMEDSVKVGSDRHTPTPWRSMPKNQTTDSQTIHTHINPDIELQLKRIAEESFGDLFLSDSQKQLEKLRALALSTNEYPICYLTLVMLVPKGNPHQFRSAKDVLVSHRKLGIVNPSADGLGETSWKMLRKIVPDNEEIPMELVRIYERQYDLLEALEQGNIDAALAWNAPSLTTFLLAKYADDYNATFENLMRAAERKKDQKKLRRILHEMYKSIIDEKSFAEVVPLTANPDERYVAEIRLVILSSAFQTGYCIRFADYMRSKQGKDVLHMFEFLTE